jgi:NADH-quinone oxidoreductase subunit L
VYDKLRVDEFYEETVIGAVDSLAEFGAWADKWIVDGVLAKLSAFVVRGTGSVLRQLQTGRIQAYAAVMVVGLGLVGWFLIAPHANAKVLAETKVIRGESKDKEVYTVTVTASPGLGYSYRWDEDGDGKWDSDEFGDKAEVSFNLDFDKGRTVGLQVKSAFGQRAVRTFDVVRPKPDRSGLTTIDVRQGADGRLQGTPRAPGQPRPPGGQPFQPGRGAPPIMPGAQMPAGHPAIPPQGK